ncbi:hypothetical protein QOZ80_4AG0322720 [Eleusine coracana subsp. coracana]|nr:hypothetical protein QOZ80_4AG0322720 [Eleusine coracana subsp. coracana]
MGKFWHVDVARGGDGAADDACFAGGWAEFVKDNALAPESFLVLRYEGNMVFTVKVFDTSGCLDYGDASVVAAGDPLSVEQTVPASEPNNTGRSSQPTLVDGTCSIQKAGKISKRKLATNGDTVKKQNKSQRIWIVGNNEDRDDTQGQDNNAEAHSDIVEEAKESDCKDTVPIYVKAVSPCNFRYSYMNIGKKFCSTNDLLSNRQMTLKDQEGKSWPVKLTTTADQARMKAGWRHFSSHHGIKVGDRCVFQLIDPHTFSVSIRRAT